MIGFYLKKFITFFIEPYGFLLTLLAIGLYFLFATKYKLAKLFISLSIFLFLLFSYDHFSNVLIKNLETKYLKYEYNKSITYIQVLGSGNIKNQKQPISSYLNSTGTKRILEGVTIYKHTPNSKLILTGYSANCNPTPAAQVYAEVAISLGVKKEDIIIGSGIKDTKEEAEFAKTIVGNEQFALVTSASHMPRSIMIFKLIGLNPIAAPTDFYSFVSKGYLLAPSIDSMNISQMAIHEYIGILWTKLITFIS